MKRRLVDKVVVTPRKCRLCSKWWPTGTAFKGRIGDAQFSCPDGRHELPPRITVAP